jgi:hypothetical protein
LEEYLRGTAIEAFQTPSQSRPPFSGSGSSLPAISTSQSGSTSESHLLVMDHSMASHLAIAAKFHRTQMIEGFS